MTLGEKLKTISDFVYRSARQSFEAFGVDADPELALMVMETATNRFRQDAHNATLNQLFALEDIQARKEELEAQKEAEKEGAADES